jgi:hypothetical protein
MEWLLDLHLGNAGEPFPTLNDHPIRNILNYFGNPEYTIVLPEERPSYLQSFPAYLVPPISISEYMTYTRCFKIRFIIGTGMNSPSWEFHYQGKNRII